MAAFAWLAELTLRSTLVLTVALGLGLLLRRSRAEARHRLLTLTALGLLLLPALPRILPSLELPLALPRLAAEAAPAAALAVFAVAPVSGASAPHDGLAKPALAPALGPSSSTQAAAPSAGGVAVIAWLVGVAAALAGLGRALARESRLLRRSQPLAGPWRESLSEAQRSLSMGREVRLLESTEIDTPLTGGWRRPAVLVPVGAAAWSDERRRLVLQHELVHVQRADGLRHLAWRLVAAFYWFHPLVRLAERQARLAGEQACDETVVGLGARPSTYARHLLEIAESLRARPEVFASALPMLDRSQLERRLVMILDEKTALGRGRATAIAGLTLLAATVLVAGAAGPQATRPFVKVPVAAAAPASAPVESPRPAARVVTATPGRAAEPARGTLAGTTCLDGDTGMSFSGHDEGSFSLQHSLGDGRRLCARVWGPVVFDERTGEIREVPRGSSVLVETGGRSKASPRMLITEEQGQPRYQFWLNGSERPVDDRARAWLKDALEAVAAFRAIGEIQGEVGTLQGEIGTIQGRIGTLQGRIGTIQGQQGTLRGKIGSIQGEQGTLQGEIGTHQGAIGSLEGARWSASESLKKQIDKEIQEHEAAIRKLEAEKDDGTLKRRLSEAQAELSAFQQSSSGQIRELERQIEAIRSENQIGRLEKQIDDLHADDRIAEIKRRLAPTLERLKARIAELGG